MHPSDSQPILDLLRDEYKNHRTAEQLVAPPSLDSFLEFAEDYLNKNRTVETYPVDSNLGVRLSNNKRCVIHPVTAAGDGSMQDSGSVGVTEGQTQPGQEGVTEAGDQKVI